MEPRHGNNVHFELFLFKYEQGTSVFCKQFIPWCWYNWAMLCSSYTEITRLLKCAALNVMVITLSCWVIFSESFWWDHSWCVLHRYKHQVRRVGGARGCVGGWLEEEKHVIKRREFAWKFESNLLTRRAAASASIQSPVSEWASWRRCQRLWWNMRNCILRDMALSSLWYTKRLNRFELCPRSKCHSWKWEKGGDEASLCHKDLSLDPNKAC